MKAKQNIMEVKINVFVRKSDHYKQPKGQEYNVKKEVIIGNTEQEVLDKFVPLNPLLFIASTLYVINQQ